MIIYKDKQQVQQKCNASDGEGILHCLYAIPKGTGFSGSSFYMIGTMTLEAGASIGTHFHEDDEECYVILKGKGRYEDNDGSFHEVKAGDVTLTFRGEKHSLVNVDKDPLVFLAIIVK
ncbi:MAG: cupin domain-containing protein [Aminobacterium sp.]|jgi:quercetin dioxygenase-like cupin family protein|uniref:cupin domain-containing protein n=1 Tax=unclassified Aminobacterium TaxID=2685012 RepID=UPI001BCC08FF|nr:MULTISPECIES: cupin domain-containing protein [unclassified Aminobacterium]MDD2206027.1 cupin domain-containing protein [Aminobacterium sp.]MDD3425754.1 cupin domain-containing protein [Aminobacterium sp.]MDD3708046.1 cupin domain-containing protein [Aminobacterium sp.]MDD4227816.1 cupin domain-containing protein [Aminobacterium sp.]MDD4550744.1 cupin domain-containing protein [Aminobacterium sp.]